MKKNINKITLDTSVERRQNVRCVVEDANSRVINIKITEKGKEYEIPTEDTIWFRMQKPDGTLIVWLLNQDDRFVKNEDGTLTVTLDDNCMSVAGVCNAEIRFESKHGEITDVLSTMSFNIAVIKNVFSTPELESRDDFIELAKKYGGTSDYNELTNIPMINGVELKGDVSLSDLKLRVEITQEEYDALSYEEQTNGTEYIITDADYDCGENIVTFDEEVHDESYLFSGDTVGSAFEKINTHLRNIYDFNTVSNMDGSCYQDEIGVSIYNENGDMLASTTINTSDLGYVSQDFTIADLSMNNGSISKDELIEALDLEHVVTVTEETISDWGFTKNTGDVTSEEIEDISDIEDPDFTDALYELEQRVAALENRPSGASSYIPLYCIKGTVGGIESDNN